MDKQKLLELIPDSLGEGRHEFVAKLAHQYWEREAAPSVPLRPTGSERNELCTHRCWRRSITQSANDVRNMGEKIYR